MRVLRAAVIVAVALSGVVAAPASAQQTTPCDQQTYTYSKVSRPGQYDVLPQEIVTLKSERDGVSIQIGLIRPKVPAGVRVPVIVQASPYFNPLQEMDLRKCSPRYTENFVAQGYAVALVPVRGTADNGGCMDLFGPAERADLDQAITWLGQQDWSTGAVGMIGKSYDGSTPWEVAALGNPYLKTIVPIEGVNDVFRLLFGAGTPDWRGPLVLNDIYYAQSVAFYLPGRAPEHTAQVAACPDYLTGSAASVYSSETGELDPFGYWSARRFRDQVERNYHGSILLAQGLQDWNVNPGEQFPWVTELDHSGFYVRYMLGQWAHNHPDDASGSARRNDWSDILLTWFDHWLKGEEVDPGPKVQVQDSDGAWRNADQWPPAGPATNLFLTSAGGLADAPSAGTSTALLTPDPLHTQGAGVYTNAPPEPLGAQCPLPSCVAFSTVSQAQPLRFAGLPRLRLSVTPAAAAGELSAYLYSTDGATAKRLGWGQVDLRFASGGEEPNAVTPGTPMTVDFTLQPLDVRVPAGQRLVLLLSEGSTYDRLPSTPNAPIVLSVGGSSDVLSIDVINPAPGDFFKPR